MFANDFYLPKHNICVEYQGIQHYEPINYFGGLKGFNDRLKKDTIKNDYCNNKNIGLIRIKYDERITEKLNNSINHVR